MKLKPIHDTEIELVSGWLSKKSNYQWLDFGAGIQQIEAGALQMMSQRDIHHFRLFTSDGKEEKPVGLVALSDINQKFYSATLWYVLGEKEYSGKNYTSRAVSKVLAEGFSELGLKAIYAWTVEVNTPSTRVLEKNNFTLIGRRRECHYIGDNAYDRLLFDLLAHEHNEN